MLKNEVLEMLDLFNQFEITAENQWEIINNGIDFDFTFGGIDWQNRNKKLGAFEIVSILKECKERNISLDVNDMINNPWLQCYERFTDMARRKDELKTKALGTKK